MVDQISDFDWSAPGIANFGCAFLSLAPGSPTLTPGSNPLLLAGAEPGDILVSCPGGFTPFLGIALPASAGDLIDPLGGGILMPHFLLGLTPADDVKGLERTSNPCPAFPGSPMDPDGDGVHTGRSQSVIAPARVN